MESLEEILKVVGGIIFAAIYLFGNTIFKSKDEDAPRPPTLPRQSGSEEDEAADRQRQIQEAIRRKILERRQAAGGEAPASSQPVGQHQEGREEGGERRKEVVERHKETHQRAPHVEPTHQEPETDGRFSWDASDNVYEQQMQERLQQIEATKRRAEALKRQAGTSNQASETTGRRQSTRRGALRSGPVRSVLRDPAAARSAIIYSEVLGKPVSMRTSGSGIE